MNDFTLKVVNRINLLLKCNLTYFSVIIQIISFNFEFKKFALSYGGRNEI